MRPSACCLTCSGTRRATKTIRFRRVSSNTRTTTRPADFKGMKVPDVLLSGNHALIESGDARRRFAGRSSAVLICWIRPSCLTQIKSSLKHCVNDKIVLCLSMWVDPPITDVPLLDAWADEDMNIEEKGRIDS